MSGFEQQLAMVEKMLTTRIEILERQAYRGIDIEPETCTWDLKDHIPVSHCRPEYVMSKVLASFADKFTFCPFCGKRIEVVQ